MKQHQFITGLVLSVLILVLAGCIKLVPVQTPEPGQPQAENQPPAAETAVPEPVEVSAKSLAAKILPLLQNKDFLALADTIHPEKGVRFSPYGYVDVEKDLVFTREEVAAFGSNQQVYNWGIYAGSGEDITLSVAEYWERFVSSQPPAQEWEVLLDPARIAGNTIDNFSEAYPDGVFVDYLQPGTETYGYMDWQNLRLGFQKSGDGNLHLIAIIHDEATP